MPTCPFGWFTAFNNPNPPCHRQTDKKELNAFLFCGKIRQTQPKKVIGMPLGKKLQFISRGTKWWSLVSPNRVLLAGRLRKRSVCSTSYGALWCPALKDFVRESTSVFKICKFRRNNRALNMQCAIYANSKSPHCCVVNCGQDDMKMTARSQKWGLLPVMFAEPLFQVGGHKISEKYYT